MIRLKNFISLIILSEGVKYGDMEIWGTNV